MIVEPTPSTWLTAFVALVVALTGSRVLAIWLGGVFTRSGSRRKAGRGAARQAIAELGAFRNACLEIGNGGRLRSNDLRRLPELRTGLMNAVAMTGDLDLLERAGAYAGLAERFAAQEATVSAEREQSEYEAILRTLTRAVRKNF